MVVEKDVQKVVTKVTYLAWCSVDSMVGRMDDNSVAVMVS